MKLTWNNEKFKSQLEPPTLEAFPTPQSYFFMPTIIYVRVIFAIECKMYVKIFFIRLVITRMISNDDCIKEIMSVNIKTYRSTHLKWKEGKYWKDFIFIHFFLFISAFFFYYFTSFHWQNFHYFFFHFSYFSSFFHYFSFTYFLFTFQYVMSLFLNYFFFFPSFVT